MSINLINKENVKAIPQEEQERQIPKYLNVLDENIELAHGALNTLESMLDGILRDNEPVNELVKKSEELVPIAKVLDCQNDKIYGLTQKIRNIQKRLEL